MKSCGLELSDQSRTKNFSCGGKEKCAEMASFYVKFSCLWWNKSMKSVAYSPNSRRLEYKWGKIFRSFPHTSQPLSPRDWVLLVQRKSSIKKVKKIFSWFRVLDPMWNANYGLKEEMEVPVLAERHRPFVAEQMIWCLLDTLSALHQNLTCLNKTFLCRGNLQSWTSVIYTSIYFYTSYFGDRDI